MGSGLPRANLCIPTTMAALCKFKFTEVCLCLPFFIILELIYKPKLALVWRWCDGVQPYLARTSQKAPREVCQNLLLTLFRVESNLKHYDKRFAMQLKSDKNIDEKKRRMVLLKNMYKGTVIFLIGTILHQWELIVRNKLFRVTIKRNISVKTELANENNCSSNE